MQVQAAEHQEGGGRGRGGRGAKEEGAKAKAEKCRNEQVVHPNIALLI